MQVLSNAQEGEQGVRRPPGNWHCLFSLLSAARWELREHTLKALNQAGAEKFRGPSHQTRLTVVNDPQTKHLNLGC